MRYVPAPVVVVSGAPASVKTTLATRLATVAVLRVDTTDGYRPSYEAIVRFTLAAPRR